jgi:hypothetical protein
VSCLCHSISLLRLLFTFSLICAPILCFLLLSRVFTLSLYNFFPSILVFCLVVSSILFFSSCRFPTFFILISVLYLFSYFSTFSSFWLVAFSSSLYFYSPYIFNILLDLFAFFFVFHSSYICYLSSFFVILLFPFCLNVYSCTVHCSLLHSLLLSLLALMPLLLVATLPNDGALYETL